MTDGLRHRECRFHTPRESDPLTTTPRTRPSVCAHPFQGTSARLIQGALAAGRAAKTQEEHAQRLDQEALDHFRAVLGIPGHEDDLGALELIAHQLARLDPRSQSALNAYHAVIRRLQAQPASPNRNRVLARVKRCLAILRYPTAHGIAQGYLTEAIQLLTQFGPPRDRDFLELAQAFHMDGIARLKIGHNVQAPLQLEFAQGHYRDLIRSLHKRRRGLFRWMLRERRFSGHRVGELEARAKEGLANVNHLIKLNNRHPDLLIASLKKGRGVPRHNRRPPR